ncbi:MAG: heparinase II/III-family protein [Planctomycetes bacterium]|nr:heparinase II/III-family protein [Planctomycetota bacterium]
MMISPDLIARARANVKKYDWAAQVERDAVAAAAPWMAMSDDELWGVMFGPTLTRSWMVWSSGYCPACKQGVPMYNWKIDAVNIRWKVKCPHCAVFFPTNDFWKFYASGLDEHAVFDHARADRSLLFNADHPDPKDPLHRFGVDDGNGFVDGDKRWRFIAAYLIYGHWKQLTLRGITALSQAYALTGDKACARKAAIMLDRVADLHPGFDHRRQSWVYEQTGDDIGCDGFVSTWHDCCEETREMGLAFGLIRDALDDPALVSFLADKAKRFSPVMPKSSGQDIRRNIEARILREALANPQKIRSNYPRAEICKAILHTELDTDDDRAKAQGIIDEMVAQSVKVDGVTGEKGLAGYSAFVIQGLAVFLAQLENARPGTLAKLIAKHPGLARTYRFHIDTWYARNYYPQIGDTGAFAARHTQYAGVHFGRMASLTPSMFTLFWRLYEVTNDAGYVQVLAHANEGKLDGLPHDLFTDDPDAFRRRVAQVLKEHGEYTEPGSVNLKEWHLAMLRSGAGANARALWIDYDTGGNHSHSDGMNIGLFARGLDLMPELGYPPVQFGGWGSDRALWYCMTGAHNTVLVDGRDQGLRYQKTNDGKAVLWDTGRACKAVRASDPALAGDFAGPRQFERTLAMVDISPEDFYVVDIFRVVGGSDHVKLQHSHFGMLETSGLKTVPCETPFTEKRFQMRQFRIDPKPGVGWTAQWRVEDRHKYLPAGTDVRLRYTDMTEEASAYTCEMWLVCGVFNTNEETWIPRIMARRQASGGGEPLASTFVSVVEPGGVESRIRSIRRLAVLDGTGKPRPGSDVAVEVVLADGRRDLIVSLDVEDPLKRGPGAGSAAAVKDGWDAETRDELTFIRRGAGAEEVRFNGRDGR